MNSRLWSTFLAVTGVAILSSAIVDIAVYEGFGMWTDVVIYLGLISGAGLGLIYGSYWYATRPKSPTQYTRLCVWILGSGIYFSGFGVISLFIGSQQVTPGELSSVVHLNGSVGLLAGLLIGTIHAQALNNAVDVAHARAKAEALKAEQERINQLDDLLRHYILNGINVMRGYLGELQDRVQNTDREYLAIVDDRAEMIATLVKHVRSLQQIEQSSQSIVMLETVLPRDTGGPETGYDVAMEVPDDPPQVRVDENLGEALELLCDSLRRSMTGDGTLQVTIDHVNDTVAIDLSAAPAELPENVKNAMFEPISSGIGLELYLAKELLPTAGTLELADNADTLIRFRVRIPFEESPG